MGFMSSLSSKLKSGGSTRRNHYDESDNSPHSRTPPGSFIKSVGSLGGNSAYDLGGAGSERAASGSGDGAGSRAWTRSKSIKGLSRPAVAGEKTKLMPDRKPSRKGILKSSRTSNEGVTGDDGGVARGGGGGGGKEDLGLALRSYNNCRMRCVPASFICVLGLAILAAVALVKGPEVLGSAAAALSNVISVAVTPVKIEERNADMKTSEAAPATGDDGSNGGDGASAAATATTAARATNGSVTFDPSSRTFPEPCVTVAAGGNSGFGAEVV